MMVLRIPEGGGTPSIGLAYPPVLEILHTHTSTLILAKNFFQEEKM